MPWRHSKRVLRLDFAPTGMDMVQASRSGKELRTTLGRGDQLTVAHARACARIVSPFRLGGATEISEPLATDFDLAKLLGIGDVATFDPRPLWASRPAADRLRVPIGIDEDGDPVELDIKESAQGGNGPHGVLIGATGSGKSELLRTLVLSLAITHSSETLNFVLVDFKGGATFLGLDQLPHTSALITNLADEVQLVARMQDALHGELVRRQELLRRAGNYSSVLDYEKASAPGRRAGPAAHPVRGRRRVQRTARRAPRVHRPVRDDRPARPLPRRAPAARLAAAGRRPHPPAGVAPVVPDRAAHLLRHGIRAVIGVPDAYELPPRPGNGYLRTDVTTLTRFKAAYVSGPYRAATTKHQRIEAVRKLVVPYVTDHLASRGARAGRGRRARPDEPDGTTARSPPARRRRRVGQHAARDDDRPARGQGPGRAPGLAAAAGRLADAGRHHARARADPRRRARPGRLGRTRRPRSCRSASSTGRSSRSATC